MNSDDYTPDDAAHLPNPEKLAADILGSEAMMWLMAGANHVESHLNSIRPAFEAWKRAETAMCDQPDVEGTMSAARDEYLETPGNFASVRDAVEDAFRAGWEAHE